MKNKPIGSLEELKKKSGKRSINNLVDKIIDDAVDNLFDKKPQKTMGDIVDSIIDSYPDEDKPVVEKPKADRSKKRFNLMEEFSDAWRLMQERIDSLLKFKSRAEKQLETVDPERYEYLVGRHKDLSDIYQDLWARVSLMTEINNLGNDKDVTRETRLELTNVAIKIWDFDQVEIDRLRGLSLMEAIKEAKKLIS